jgi:hypothetical protein
MSGERRWSPIWGAFTSTTVATVYLVAGLTGYQLNKRTRFLATDAWTGSIIWWQVWAGLALLPVAYYFWRRGATEIDRRIATEKSSHRLDTD